MVVITAVGAPGENCGGGGGNCGVMFIGLEP